MTDTIEDYVRARQAGAPPRVLDCTHEPTLLRDEVGAPNSDQGKRHLLLENATPSDEVVVHEGAPLELDEQYRLNAVYQELVGAALEDDRAAFYERFNEAVGIKILARLRQMEEEMREPFGY
jgi:hypothetical protein